MAKTAQDTRMEKGRMEDGGGTRFLMGFGKK
jgi:hypothetical protein